MTHYEVVETDFPLECGQGLLQTNHGVVGTFL